MRETTNRTPAWVYVVSVVSALALGLGTIAIADYLRPSKIEERRQIAQAKEDRLIAEERERARLAELKRRAQEASDRREAQRAAEEAEQRRKVAEKNDALSRYRNNGYRTTAEGYFFKGIKYSNGDGVFENARTAIKHFHRARDNAGIEEIKTFNRQIRFFGSKAVEYYNISEYTDGN